MRLGLRMGLNSRQGGGGDLPSLDLAFALDKAITARKGPTPTFTRVQETSTGSTYIGADRLIKYAAANEPRFDHDSVTGVCKGLLIEESRTNLIVPSNNFSIWGINGGSTSTPNHQAPDGNSNSFLFSEDSNLAVHRIFNSFAGTIGTTYTTSVFLKFAGRSETFIETRSISTYPYAVFNLQTGTVGFVSPGITANMKQFPNGWWRCVITGTADLAGGNTLIGGIEGGVRSYVGLNAPAFYIFGAQVEVGSYPLSYIVTTSSTAIRGADTSSIIGTDFNLFYNQSEGTFFSSASISNLTGINRGIAQIDDGSNTHIIRHYYDINGFKVQVRANDVTSIFLSITGVADVAQKLAISHQGTSFNAVANGGTAVSATRTSPVGLNALRIGSLVGGPFYINGHIARIQYFRKRLSNEKLQALTAP